MLKPPPDQSVPVLCVPPASPPQRRSLGAGMEQNSVLNTLSQDGAGWPGSFSQSPEGKSWESPLCQSAVSISEIPLSVFCIICFPE